MPEVLTAQEYFAFGFAIPNRNYVLNKEYRYGFNGKENDNEIRLDTSGEPISGSEQDYGMRIYDPRIGRFLSVDPITSTYPMLTPYQFASNNPIANIDIDGLEGKKPIVIGKTKAVIVKISNDDIVKNLDAMQASTTGLSSEYMKRLIKEERISLKMYDKDGNKGQGGNATIGAGHLIHVGAIGSTQYDSKAVEKEKQYKYGITLNKAFSILSGDLNEKVKETKIFLKNKDVTVDDQNVLSVLFDIYFNQGVKPLKAAIDIYDDKGLNGLYNAIKVGTVKSVDAERKDIRLDLLKTSIDAKNKEKDSDSQPVKSN
jgi:RHS repeat-associated protein